MTRLAVFDCDGTLVDSQANICRAMEACFAEHRLDPPGREAIHRIVGLSLVPAIAPLVPAAEAEQHAEMAEAYKRAFHTMRSDCSLDPEPLFDGVATGKSDRGLAHILDYHGLTHRFVTLQTADRHPSKPHPAMLATAIAEAGATPETTAMIGDTSFDIEMAVNAVGVAGAITARGSCTTRAHARWLTDTRASRLARDAMSADPTPRSSYFTMVAVQIVATAGAVSGLMLTGRATNWYQSILGAAILLSGLYVIAVVPRAMARCRRTPPQ